MSSSNNDAPTNQQAPISSFPIQIPTFNPSQWVADLGSSFGSYTNNAPASFGSGSSATTGVGGSMGNSNNIGASLGSSLPTTAAEDLSAAASDQQQAQASITNTSVMYGL